jgi:carbonic anhydrase
MVEITYRYGTPGILARPRPSNADSARRRLTEGNRTFAALLDHLGEDSSTRQHIVEVDSRDLGLQPDERSVPYQRPFAAVLGCSDARVPIELIFNEGPNDLFVIRVAGNGLGNDVLGSLRYAVQHLCGSLRLVVVLGHTGCGAMSAAVDAFLDPTGYLPLATDHSLRSILDRQLVVVQVSARKLGSVFGSNVVKHKKYREALIDTSIATNAALTAYTLQQELQAMGNHKLRAVYGVYLLESREVWAPCEDAGRAIVLADPPKDLASFVELGEAIVSSERIASLLAGGP